MHVLVEQLTDELKSLVGWRAVPHRLVYKPVLCRLAGVTDDMSLTVAGGVVRHYLITSINSLTGAYEFEGKQLSAEKLRIAYRLLLGIQGSKQAESRRRRVIFLTGVHTTADQWRRPHGPERDLLRILATHMVSQTA